MNIYIKKNRQNTRFIPRRTWQKNKNRKFYSTTYKDISDTTLIKYFESCNKNRFLKQWKGLIPDNMKFILHYFH